MTTNQIKDQIYAFFIIGFGIAMAVALLILFFYLFVWGAIIGLVLWGVMLIKIKFFSAKTKAFLAGDRIIDVTEFREKKKKRGEYK